MDYWINFCQMSKGSNVLFADETENADYTEVPISGGNVELTSTIWEPESAYATGVCSNLSVTPSATANIIMEWWCGTTAGSYPALCTSTYTWFLDTDSTTGAFTIDGDEFKIVEGGFISTPSK